MENDHKEKQNFQFPKSILQGDTFYPDLFTFLIQSSNVCVCVYICNTKNNSSTLRQACKLLCFAGFKKYEKRYLRPCHGFKYACDK